MNPYKKWCIGTITTTLVGLLLVAALVVIVDPFFHYHKPLAGFLYDSGDGDYSNPGIVRHFDYDTLVVGTSMSQNFRASLFAEQLGANAVKTIYAGGKSKNFSNLLRVALDDNPQLRTIYMGLDLHMLGAENPDVARDPYPVFMYDKFYGNDVNYLFNKHVLVIGEGVVLVNALEGKPPVPLFEDNSWATERIDEQFARTYVHNKENRQPDPLTKEERLALAEAHLQHNIVPYIAGHPEVEFVFFIPPYSILYWYIVDLDNMLAVLEYTIETLIPYENVQVFFPMNDPEIITNLKNYHDIAHYGGEINDYLVRCFKDGTYLLTAENYQEELAKQRALVEGFAWEVFD